MWPVLWVLKRCIGSMVGVAADSAVFWGVLHSLTAPAWGLVVAWPEFLQAVEQFDGSGSLPRRRDRRPQHRLRGVRVCRFRLGGALRA